MTEEFYKKLQKDFVKQTEKKQEAHKEWLNNNRESLERALSNIDKHQERKLQIYQIVVLVFIGAAFINLLTSAIYDFSVTMQRFYWDFGIASISAMALILILFGVKRELSKYKPAPVFLSFSIAPTDLKPLLTDLDYIYIMNYLEEGKLTDFRTVGKNVFEVIDRMFPQVISNIFNQKGEIKPKAYEDLRYPQNEEAPALTKVYEFTPFNTDVKLAFEVKLVPDYTHFLTKVSDMSACHNFWLFFYLVVSNPEHCDSGRIVNECYSSVASSVLEISAISVNSAFYKQKELDSTEKKE